MATVQYPLVNGVYHAFASVEIKWDGTIYVGVKSVNYKQNLVPTKVRGAHAEPIGRTRGDLDADGDIELYLQQANQLLTAMGPGYMEKVIGVTVSYSENGLDTITDEIVSARIQEIDDSHSQGVDALTKKFTLNIMKVLYNGVEPLLNPLSGQTVQQ
jgi:hypothetical protein